MQKLNRRIRSSTSISADARGQARYAGRKVAGNAVQIASEFVRLKVDVVVRAGTALALEAKQATSVIPIVFTGAGDPVATGLVASLL